MKMKQGLKNKSWD